MNDEAQKRYSEKADSFPNARAYKRQRLLYHYVSAQRGFEVLKAETEIYVCPGWRGSVN